MRDQFILVTGTKRSGTTWVGQVLSSNGETAYVHEPFNPMNARVRKSPIELTYHFINDEINAKSGDAFSSYLDEYLNPGFHFLWQGIKGYKHVDSRYVLPLRQFRDIRRADRKVVKDPCALLSMDWLTKYLSSRTVILIRHPAAYVNSMMAKDWYFDPRVFKYQADPLRAIFQAEWGVVSQIDFEKYKEDHFENLIAGWRLLNHFIIEHASTAKNSIVIRHEDLLENPHDRFQELFRRLDLKYNKRVIERIENLKIDANPKQLWKEELSLESIHKIKVGTSGIWQNFYEEKDW